MKDFNIYNIYIYVLGAVLTVVYGSGFGFDTLRNGLNRTFLDGKEAYNNVIYIVSKLSNDNIQIVLSDETGTSGIAVGTAMKTELDSGKLLCRLFHPYTRFIQCSCINWSMQR